MAYKFPKSRTGKLVLMRNITENKLKIIFIVPNFKQLTDVTLDLN